MASYTHPNAMDIDGDAGPGFAPEVSERTASLAPDDQHSQGEVGHRHHHDPLLDGLHVHPGNIAVSEAQEGERQDAVASPPTRPQMTSGQPIGEKHYDSLEFNEPGFVAQLDSSAEGQISEAPPTLDAPAPQVAAHMQDLCARYVASYDKEATPNSDRMEFARVLALALLQHHYPKSEGYVIQPSSLGPVAKYGLNFSLKADDGSDPVFNALPPKKDPKKSKNRKPSKAQQTAEYLRQFDHSIAFAASVKWHMIESDDIAGFEVLKKLPLSDGSFGEDVYRPHTYLAIMIDNLQTFPSIAENNDVHRGDLLTDVLCRGQAIRAGHGILLFGTRLEFYRFDNGASFDPNKENSTSAEEPSVMLCKSANDMDLEIDMRLADLQTVNRMFREAAAMGVEYIEGNSDAKATIVAELCAEATVGGEDDEYGEQQKVTTDSVI